jgi:hypothetical protein
LFGGANYNMHSSNISPQLLFPTPTRIDINSNVNSISGVFGITGDFELSKLFVLGGKIGFSWAGADFKTERPPNYQYDFNTSLSYLEFEPAIKFTNFIPGFESFFLTTGFNFGIPISSSYDATQMRNNRTDNISGNVPDAAMRMAIPIGIGYI